MANSWGHIQFWKVVLASAHARLHSFPHFHWRRDHVIKGVIPPKDTLEIGFGIMGNVITTRATWLNKHFFRPQNTIFRTFIYLRAWFSDAFHDFSWDAKSQHVVGNKVVFCHWISFHHKRPSGLSWKNRLVLIKGDPSISYTVCSPKPPIYVFKILPTLDRISDKNAV